MIDPQLKSMVLAETLIQRKTAEMQNGHLLYTDVYI
jgi:hypothetical protein